MSSRIAAAALIALASLALPAGAADPSLASADGRFAVVGKRIANGGGHSTGAAYSLDAAIGQGEASTRLEGGGYEATLGVQARIVAPVTRPDALFANSFE